MYQWQLLSFSCHSKLELYIIFFVFFMYCWLVIRNLDQILLLLYYFSLLHNNIAFKFQLLLDFRSAWFVLVVSLKKNTSIHKFNKNGHSITDINSIWMFIPLFVGLLQKLQENTSEDSITKQFTNYRPCSPHDWPKQ